MAIHSESDQLLGDDNARVMAAQKVSTWRMLLGLLVIWASLFTVFMAQNLSDTVLETNMSDPRIRLEEKKFLLPLKLSARSSSPRHWLKNVALSTGYQISEQDLAKAPNEPANLDFQNVPLYKVFHQLLGNPRQWGLALVNNRIETFEQSLETEAPQDKQRMINWKAQHIALSEQTKYLFPSGLANIWFSARLAEISQDQDQPRTIELEVWQDDTWLAKARAVLNEQGGAQFNMATRENIVFSIQRKISKDNAENVTYDLALFYQSAKEDAALQDKP